MKPRFPGGLSRRGFLAGLALAPRARAEGLTVGLQGTAGLSVDGPHRFVAVGGWTGFQPTSLHTRAEIKTGLHRAPRGTLSLWFSPLEDLTFSPSNQSQSQVPFKFPFLTDFHPGREVQRMKFGIFFTNTYPELVAKFAAGEVFPTLDHQLAPFVYVEAVRLRQGSWYHLALTWDRAARRLAIYLNGMLAGLNLQAENFEEAAPLLYVGNPMMLLRELRIEDREARADEIAAQYRAGQPAANEETDADLRRLLEPAFGAPLDLRRDASWSPVFERAFTRPGDLEGWLRQGPSEKYMHDFRMEITPEGLYLKTPAQIENETRMYLWSPANFEGDQWIEFDFRLESPKGLALLVLCASGMQREDYITDHGLPANGGMGFILRDLRNYHWEFVRRVEAMRPDVETQYLAKNPFGRRLHCGAIPRLEEDRWVRLRMIKAGPRLHGSMDGRTVFDVTDSPFDNNGPVYNFGRIAFRQMYHTALRYRNLTVFQRPQNRSAAGARK